jgi:ABC-2 type transport system ATP-binding protein
MTGAHRGDVVLSVKALKKRFGDFTAVDGLSFEVRRGEVLGFLGPNGAGKTTSMKMMCGLMRPDAGSVELDGQAIRAGGSLRDIGVAPQNLVIWETLTCLEQLELTGQFYDLPPARARQEARRWLERFGLAEKANRLGKTLSGGMQRRLNIALGLVHEPRLLFLDEPQAGLDPQSRVLVREVLQSLKGTMTIVITTHDMEEAEKLADRVCIIDHGALLVQDTLEGLKRQHGEGRVVEVAVEGGSLDALAPALCALATPGTISVHEGLVLVPPEGELLAAVLAALARAGHALGSVRTREKTLEDVFIGLTGRRLRE